MENHAEYGRSIYYHNGNDLYISQFVASRLDWKGRGHVTQNTGFPEEERSVITINLSRPGHFAVNVRVPWWAGESFRIKVNGSYSESRFLPTSWAKIERKWYDGDVIEVEFPFSIHIERMADDPSLFAIMNGPLVLAADLGDEGLTDYHRYQKNQRGMHRYKAPDLNIPVFKPGDRDLSAGLIPEDGGFSVFTTADMTEPAGITLKPYFKIGKERYMIYFRQADYKPLAKPWNLD